MFLSTMEKEMEGQSNSNSMGQSKLTASAPDLQLQISKKDQQDQDKRENISVFVRLRPINQNEISKNAAVVFDCPGQREVVCRERGPGCQSKTFTFDKVFGPQSKQIDVYKAVVSPLLEEVLLGYSCTVFAYGQTGTGKTYTMEGGRTPGQKEGDSWESDPLAGIVPRAMSQLFDELRVLQSEFTVRVSLVEMYNEEVYDLLSPAEDSKIKTVRLYEDSSKKDSVHIKDLEEVIVHNKHEVYSIMERGSQMRKTASTHLNANSSRSHTVFTVTVNIKESNPLGEDLMRIGKLHLVDLAGSENIGRSGAVNKRAREAGSINQSLLTLGRVITALVERTPHVPYRESKLTRLLKDSLGGKTKTSIIATISPSSVNVEETLSTLDYAHRAKNIQNRPEVNQKLTKKAMLREYTEEIERLRKDLLAAREKNGIFVDKENYERMLSQIESQDQDLTQKIQQARSLEEQLQEKDKEIAEVNATLIECQEELEGANALIDSLKADNAGLTKQLNVAKREKDGLKNLVKVMSSTEANLTEQANTLLMTVSETTVNLDKLHSRLERKKSVESANLEAGRKFQKNFYEDLKSLVSDVNTFRVKHSEFSGVQRLQLDENLQDKDKAYQELKETISNQKEYFQTAMGKMMEYNTSLLESIQNVTLLEQSQTLKTKEELSKHCESTSELSEDFKQKLHASSGKLNEFWDATFLVDGPTGATPQRKIYSFPRQLAKTSKFEFNDSF